MSYIPDFRAKKNYKLLNETHRAWLNGYMAAMKDARSDYVTASENNAEDIREEFDMLTECSEIKATCSIFDIADYIPEDAELIDVNQPLYGNKVINHRIQDLERNENP